MKNSILHIDMNNFYASVETIFRPDLRDIPMAVAGEQENRHGIILAKNQIAKGFGVKTAETIWKARQKCPNLVLVEPHFERYHEYSQRAMEVYSEYTDRIESFGLDECWLDVEGSETLFGSSVHIANEIRERVKNELNLTVSVGVSFTKTFAKLGSDFKKPDAVTLFSKENLHETVWQMSANELLYVGPSTAKKLAKYGITTIGDIAGTDINILSKMLGKMGESLYLMANGLDNNEVKKTTEQRELKTIGNSTTLPRDISEDSEVKVALLSLAETVARRLRKHGKRSGEIQISVRSKDFEDMQRQVQLETSVCDTKSIHEAAYKLYLKEKRKWKIRGLGIRAGKLTDEEEIQFSFFESDKKAEKREKLENTMDKIKDKYGDGLIKSAALYDMDNLQEEEYPGFSRD